MARRGLRCRANHGPCLHWRGTAADVGWAMRWPDYTSPFLFGLSSGFTLLEFSCTSSPAELPAGSLSDRTSFVHACRRQRSHHYNTGQGRPGRHGYPLVFWLSGPECFGAWAHDKYEFRLPPKPDTTFWSRSPFQRGTHDPGAVV